MFIDDNFMLHSTLAVQLYNEVKDLPIIDYHNHLDPKEIYENKAYSNISDIWLQHDHYKWRLMRLSGVNESYITGYKDKSEKFKAYIESLEQAYMNPLYHWTHMELKEYFQETDVISSEESDALYERINQLLLTNPKGPRDYLEEMKVESICTTDDLLSDLKYHELIQKDPNISIKVLPTFRPDRLFKIEDEDFLDVIASLERISSTTISDIVGLQKSLHKRLDFFQERGCVVADHGISYFKYHEVSELDASFILKKRLEHTTLTRKEIEEFKIYLLGYFIGEYSKRKILTQFHIGAIRNSNQRMYEECGADSGFDSIANETFIKDLNEFFSFHSYKHDLPHIVLYSLNAKDYEALASICGNFSKGNQSRIQVGAPWWFNDHYQGIKEHLTVYSTYLNIGNFIGMLTDSRSYLSFVRHDYFRRILCDFIASKVAEGHIPSDLNSLIKLVRNISYYNTKEYIK